MMVAPHCQQRRTGHTRRRLNYACFLAISEDFQSALVLRPGNSSQSSQDDDIFPQTTSTGLTTQSGEEWSASESFSLSAVVASEEGIDAVNSDLKRPLYNVGDIRNFERTLQYRKRDTYTSEQDLNAEQLGGLGFVQVKASMKHTNKWDNATKDEERQQRRGTRKRKPKVPYEISQEFSISRKPNKRIRQMRIMRHLGLAAPHGSPFTSTYVVGTAA